MKNLSRKEMREQAFILCFQTLFKEISLEEAIEAAKESDDVDFSSYAIACASGIIEERENLDLIIEKYLKKGWRLSRISMSSHAILLLALYEIKFNDSVPNAVAVNEAIELSKKYTDSSDSSFINGILGSYLRDNNE